MTYSIKNLKLYINMTPLSKGKMTFEIFDISRLVSISLFVLFLLLSFHLTAQTNDQNTMQIEVDEITGELSIASKNLILNSALTLPVTNPELPKWGSWSFEGRSERIYNLGGIMGKILTDTYSTKGFDLLREVWIADGQEQMAIRQVLKNHSGEPLQLESMQPLNVIGENEFIYGKSPAENWEILAQKRLKNGRPRAFKPQPDQIEEIDPFFVIGSEDLQQNKFLIGYLSYELHLAKIVVSFDERLKFKSMETICNFEGVVIKNASERTSQWVTVSQGHDSNDLIGQYANQVGQHHDISKPVKRPPSVYCTWYYHAVEYNEDYFTTDIQTFSEDRVPFDVFLIDECWSLNRWGDFEAIDQFPSGMKWVAEQIEKLNYTPGIWSCPFLVDEESQLAQNHPEWILKNSQGEYCIFEMNERDHWILDLTYPGVTDYLEMQFDKISNDWGYDYFKFDFMRAVFLDTDQQFYDKEATSLEAYRRGLEAIRRGVGPEAYINVCGGHYGASMGIAQAQRSGSDVLSIWSKDEIPKFRQNILRTWMSRLWHVDPDAMMVRRSDTMVHNNDFADLTLGLFTDDEANTNTLNQYIGGGLVSFTEDFAILDKDRRSLYRHVIPSINSQSIPLDPFDTLSPNLLLTKIDPIAKGLPSWNTLSVVNWTDEVKSYTIELEDKIIPESNDKLFVVFEFFSQKLVGVYKKGDMISLDNVNPHESKLLRIMPWDGKQWVLAGTDLHFSGGGVEISEWNKEDGQLSGMIDSEWDYPIRVSILGSDDSESGYFIKTMDIQANQGKFNVQLDH